MDLRVICDPICWLKMRFFVDSIPFPHTALSLVSPVFSPTGIAGVKPFNHSALASYGRTPLK
jgi:hypothetical protein